MRIIVQCFALGCALLSCALADSVPDPEPIDVSDRYIITLKPDVDVVKHLGHVKAIGAQSSQNATFDGVTQKYDFAGFRGYAGQFGRDMLESLREHKDVAAIEADQVFAVSDLVVQEQSSSALGSISHQQLNKDNLNTYAYDGSAGAGTFGYVIDSGIKLDHVEFGHRAYNGYNAVKFKKFKDDKGHGTHVAGLIGSRTYGVAKNCTLIAVKVTAASNTPGALMLDGIQWAVKDILKKHRRDKSAINISLSGPYSKAYNSAIDAVFSKGITVVASAGNQAGNADKRSPASAKGAITVGGTDSRRKRLRISNYGKDVTIFAPGYKIRSTWNRSKTSTYSLTGTSMSAAYVTGVVLYLKGIKNLSNAKNTRACLVELALKDAVPNPAGAPNLFVYNGSGR